jgi:hypothetical protein
VSGPGPTPPRVTPAALEALDADDWARVLPVARRALAEIDPADDAEAVERLRALPTGRLVGGAARRELCRVLLADAPRRRRLLELLEETGELERLADHLGDPGTQGPQQEAAEERGRVADERARRARDQQRLRRLRQERDQARRQADGARARAEAAEREAADAREEAAALHRELTTAREALERADEERRRAVDRERRRSRAGAEQLRRELRDARRELDEAVARAAAPPAPAQERPTPASPPARTARPWVAARPTRLPDTVAWDTAEAVDLLLEPGRLVLVDGYNVTRRHRPSLGLEGQRDWLVRRLATLAAQRRVRPVVVFDGERGSSSRPIAGARGVQVRFTPAGITADDELVFAVEAMPPDEPVLVVTDDRELAERLRRLRADVVGTGPFLWATPG